MAMGLMSQLDEVEALTRLIAAVDAGDLAGAETVLDEIKAGGDPAMTVRMASGGLRLPALGLVFAEAEAVGATVRRWCDEAFAGVALPKADDPRWADLVQFVNRVSRDVIAGRGDAADGESEVA